MKVRWNPEDTSKWNIVRKHIQNHDYRKVLAQSEWFVATTIFLPNRLQVPIAYVHQQNAAQKAKRPKKKRRVMKRVERPKASQPRPKAPQEKAVEQNVPQTVDQQQPAQTLQAQPSENPSTSSPQPAAPRPRRRVSSRPTGRTRRTVAKSVSHV
ncbi:hypothetical protein PCE1_004964 [Barthelona sp. PCE]